ncbi:MAG: YgaP-like transmembrane domain [Bacteroidota bacterium]
MKLVKFMTSAAGRAARVALGLGIMAAGLLAVKGTPGTIMSLAALIPLSGGLFDFCLIGYAMGYPLNGREARRQLAGR